MWLEVESRGGDGGEFQREGVHAAGENSCDTTPGHVTRRWLHDKAYSQSPLSRSLSSKYHPTSRQDAAEVLCFTWPPLEDRFGRVLVAAGSRHAPEVLYLTHKSINSTPSPHPLLP